MPGPATHTRSCGPAICGLRQHPAGQRRGQRVSAGRIGMVVVFGSINLDLVTRVPRLPSPGETLIGSGFASYPGGKGANQALAAARAGAVVRMYGAVGRDAAAASALALLRAGGVDVAGIRAVDAPTGCATILVDDAGENAIVVVPGANERVDAGRGPRRRPGAGRRVAAATRSPAVGQRRTGRARGAGRHAHRAQCGASAAADRELLAMIATLIVNESEAAALATAVRLAGGSRRVRRRGSSGDRRPRGRRHPGRGRCDQRRRPRSDSRPRAKCRRSSTRPAPATHSSARSPRRSTPATIGEGAFASPSRRDRSRARCMARSLRFRHATAIDALLLSVTSRSAPRC